jgi:AraC-like DNA-binding protein
MVTEQVRIWRPRPKARVLLMAGSTDRYAVAPRGEYVFGVIEAGEMGCRRGSVRRRVGPGRLLAWDPSAPHSGGAPRSEPWRARLMVIEAPALGEVGPDGEEPLYLRREFPDPVLHDRRLAESFLRLHRALEADVLQMQLEQLLGDWLRELDGVGEDAPFSPSPADLRALERAREFVGEEFRREIGLDELATAAGVDKYRLTRIFRGRYGLPPHALQIAHRVRAARVRLEHGDSPAAAAAATGFVDQSHLHRHFRRTLGMTPGEYGRRAAAA